MSTYLLNWNPKRWDWIELEESIAELAELGWFEARWSCGVTKSIRPGDRFYLIRLGLKPKGIVGSGYYIVSASFEDLHWDQVLAASGSTARFVNVVFDALLNADSEHILEIDLLQADPLLSQINWLPQASCIRVPDEIAEKLQGIWSEFLGVSKLPEDFGDITPTVYREGHVREKSLTVFERSTAAREKCLEYYGTKCFICQFDFKTFYGPVADGYIQVHHLLPISDIGEEYEVDPVKDLRPVCPNCHAIIHRRRPSYSIEDIRGFIKQNLK